MSFSSFAPLVQGAIIGATGVGLGTFINAIFNALNSRSIRRAEERKMLYDIASKLAVEQWKLDVERTDAFNKELKAGGVFRPPRGILDLQVPIPRIARIVAGIIKELDDCGRPTSRLSRLQVWYKSIRNSKK